MNCDNSRAGSSVATTSGICLRSSSNATLISRRARLAPRQKWAPPPPKPRCGLGLRARSNVQGSANFDSSRLAEQYHRRPCHRRPSWCRATQCLGSGCGACRPPGGPPHDLLDRGGRQAVEVRPPPVPLLGIAGQCQHAVSDRVARRLVAGHHQQDEERRDLLDDSRSPSTSASTRLLVRSSWWLTRRSSASAVA